MNSPITKMDGWFVGANKILEWTVLQQDERTIQDISGWTMEFRLARAPGQASVLTKTANPFDPGNGVCQAVIVPADTLPLPSFTYYYELWRTNSGFADVVADGKAVLRERVA